MVVDDQPTNLRLLARILADEGFDQIRTAADGREAVRLFADSQPDLVLLDLNMPGMDGFAVLEQLRLLTPIDTFLPILVLTGDSSGPVRRRALSAGASDFLGKPFDAVEVLLRIRNLLETRRLHLLLRRQNESLEAAVVERTRELREAQVEVLERLADAAEFRDDETGQHTHRVGALALRLARRLRLPESRVDLLHRAAPLHDVGKIGIPDRILLKPGRLDDDERAVMQTHTIIGASILAGGRAELVRMAECVARSHHERWDGSGYPDRLAGDAIPIEARIVAVADVIDALTHDRPYRKAWASQDVIDYVRSETGRHFDPLVTEALLIDGLPEAVVRSDVSECE
ncbi:MAG: response regulator [Gemmatimonadaceae bacterium]